MNKIKTVIVDDELEAREGVEDILKKDASIEVVGVCRNGLDAIQTINEQKPDLIFLDIQMPQINGFEVLTSIDVPKVPKVIFITAFDSYAIQAFEVHAVDYLLKPFSEERFFEALNHAKELFSKTALDHIDEKLNSLLTNYKSEKLSDLESNNDMLIYEKNQTQNLPERLVIKSSGKIFFVPLNEIIWIEAFDYYVKVHIKEKFYLLRESMKKLEIKLSSQSFIRIHKSSIINTKYIKELEPLSNGEYAVKLLNGKQLKLSRGFKKNMMNILGEF